MPKTLLKLDKFAQAQETLTEKVDDEEESIYEYLRRKFPTVRIKQLDDRYFQMARGTLRGQRVVGYIYAY